MQLFTEKNTTIHAYVIDATMISAETQVRKTKKEAQRWVSYLKVFYRSKIMFPKRQLG